jgi:hypothetical protein
MFKRHVRKSIQILAVALTVSGCALAQYGGGGGGMGGTGTGGTYTPGSRSYGNGAAIGAAVGGAAGAGVLFYALHRRHAQVVGCVTPDGKTLNTDDGKHAYQLSGAPTTGGEHVSVVGKKKKNETGADELEVASVKKDLGQCQQQAALAPQQP